LEGKKSRGGVGGGIFSNLIFKGGVGGGEGGELGRKRANPWTDKSRMVERKDKAIRNGVPPRGGLKGNTFSRDHGE